MLEKENIGKTFTDRHGVTITITGIVQKKRCPKGNRGGHVYTVSGTDVTLSFYDFRQRGFKLCT